MKVILIKDKIVLEAESGEELQILDIMCGAIRQKCLKTRDSVGKVARNKKLTLTAHGMLALSDFFLF